MIYETPQSKPTYLMPQSHSVFESLTGLLLREVCCSVSMFVNLDVRDLNFRNHRFQYACF